MNGDESSRHRVLCALCCLDERGDDGVHCIVVLDECGDEPSGSR